MAYPDTLLHDDEADPLYGGRPGSEFGGLAWEWAANVLRFLSQAHLAYNRASYRTIAVTVTNAVDPGDVVVVDLNGGAGGAIVARKAASGDSGSSTVRVLGVCAVGAAAGRRAVVARDGVVPRLLTGFAELAAAATPISVDYTTGKLKVAAGVEPVIGAGDRQGNVLLEL